MKIKTMKLLLFVLGIVYAAADEMYIGTENVGTTQPETRICATMKLEDNTTYHFTGFEPVVGSNVHHVTLNGCNEPSTNQKYWYCGNPPSPERDYTWGPICKERKIFWIYSWSRRSSKAPFSVPEGFSYQVGKDTYYKNLIFEVHYASSTLSKNFDESKAGLVITYEKKPITDTVLSMLVVRTFDYFLIPAKRTTTIDMTAEVSSKMHPILFDVHVHGLGTKVSGYLIRRNKQNPDNPTWIQLGLQSPPFPQDKFPVANNVTVEPGDIIATRCTYYNDREQDAKTGSDDADEMCEFGIYFARKRGTKLPRLIKKKVGNWSEMGLKNIPNEA